MDLLTNYTHDPELQVSTVSPLISMIHTLPRHTINLYPDCCVFISRSLQRLLTVGILQLRVLRSFLHSLPYKTHYQLTSFLCLYFGMDHIHSSYVLASNCWIIKNLLYSNENMFPSHCPETVTVYRVTA
jgi:hypothetical protein